MTKEGAYEKKSNRNSIGYMFTDFWDVYSDENVEAFDTYTASLAESESDTSDGCVMKQRRDY